MIELQRLAAMRSGEAVTMRGRDIQMSGEVWIYVPESHKTEHHGRGREIYLGPQSQAAITPFLTTDLNAYLFSPKDAEAERLAEQANARSKPTKGKREAEGLLFGTTPAQALLEHQEADVPPLARFALLRSYLPALERSRSALARPDINPRAL